MACSSLLPYIYIYAYSSKGIRQEKEEKSSKEGERMLQMKHMVAGMQKEKERKRKWQQAGKKRKACYRMEAQAVKKKESPSQQCLAGRQGKASMQGKAGKGKGGGGKVVAVQWQQQHFYEQACYGGEREEGACPCLCPWSHVQAGVCRKGREGRKCRHGRQAGTNRELAGKNGKAKAKPKNSQNEQKCKCQTKKVHAW